MVNSARKILQYRKAIITNTSKTLGELLSAALSEYPRAVDRQEQLDSGSEFRLINSFLRGSDGFILAQMVLIEPGASQPVVYYQDEATSYQLRSIKPNDVLTPLDEDLVKARKDFVNSMLYFGVLGNHVIVLGSRSLNSKSIEAYLRWLLVDKCKILTNQSVIALSQEVKLNYKEMILNSNVRKVEIGDCINNANDGIERGCFHQSITRSMFRDLLAQFFNNQSVDESVLNDSNLKLKVILSYNRKTDENGRKLLSHIALNCRNIDDSEVKLQLDGVGSITKEDICLRQAVTINCNEEGLMVMSDISNSMLNWLLTLLQTEGFTNET